MPPRLVTKGDMTSRRVLSVVFKILKCTSHFGIGLGWDTGALPPTGLHQRRHLNAGGSEVLSRARATESNVDAVGEKRAIHTPADMTP